MEKTKFWSVGDNLFKSKIEAQYFYQEQYNQCYCRKGFPPLGLYHSCCSPVKELSISEVLKDKKYRKFLDSKLVELLEQKNKSISEVVKIEQEIKDIEIEKANINH